MSATLRHPFRLDAAGAIGTVRQATPAHAVEVVYHVVACQLGERPLAPSWGVSDPLANGLDADDIRSAVAYCEPDIDITYVDVTPSPDGMTAIAVDATWKANA